MARGAVETIDEQILEREEWQKVHHSFQSEGDDDLMRSTVLNQEIPMSSSPAEELEERTPETTLTIAAIAQLEELTEDEEKERHRLELKVERAFVEAGTALRELRDKRLYRSTHRTFEDYCRERFAFTRMAAHFKIAAATIWENLYTNGIQTLPSSERQVRELATIEPEQQPLVWQQAIEQANGRIPSGRIVKGIIERLKEKPLILATDFCSIGDVFTLNRLEGAERKYNGCWAITREHRDFTIAVDVHDTTLSVKPDNLDPIDLPDVRRQLPETLKRIKHLRNCGLLDRCAYTVLESLGRQIYLTDFEADLLTFMEQRYGIS